MGKEVIFDGVPAEMLDIAWPTLAPMVLKPLQRTGADKCFSLENILQACREQKMQLWTALVDDVPVAAFVTQIITFPRRQVFDVFLVGGEQMDDWIEKAWATLKAYAKDCHCDGIRGFGRPGWVKRLPDDIEYSVMWDLDL